MAAQYPHYPGCGSDLRGRVRVEAVSAVDHLDPNAEVVHVGHALEGRSSCVPCPAAHSHHLHNRPVPVHNEVSRHPRPSRTEAPDGRGKRVDLGSVDDNAGDGRHAWPGIPVGRRYESPGRRVLNAPRVGDHAPRDDRCRGQSDSSLPAAEDGANQSGQPNPGDQQTPQRTPSCAALARPSSARLAAHGGTRHTAADPGAYPTAALPFPNPARKLRAGASDRWPSARWRHARRIPCRARGRRRWSGRHAGRGCGRWSSHTEGLRPS